VRLIRYDGRGFGSSDRDTAKLTAESELLDLAAVCEASGAERVFLFATLIQGRTAVRFAARHRERVAGVILWTSAALASGREFDWGLAAELGDLKYRNWRSFTNAWARSLWGWDDAQYARRWARMLSAGSSAEAMDALHRAYADLDATADAERLTVPTLVVGHAKTPRSVEISHATAAVIPNAQLVIQDTIYCPWASESLVEDAAKIVLAFIERSAHPMPEVHYATTTDGVRIAYTDEGEGQALVHVSQLPWNHLERELDLPQWRAWHEALGSGRRYIRYDGRGRGLSDREGHTIGVETEVRDLEAVVEAAGLEAFDLYSGIQSSMTALMYAARHPSRVRKLALWMAYSANANLMNSPLGRAGRAMSEAEYTAHCAFAGNVSAGPDHPEASRAIAQILQDSANSDLVDTWVSEPYLSADVTHVLPDVRCPVLLFDHRGFPIELNTAADLAIVQAGLANAQVVVRETPSYTPFMDDLDDSVKTIREFFDSPGFDGAHEVRAEAAGV
jgi:pimeloyl-ACP methyl ester carboxylesterase